VIERKGNVFYLLQRTHLVLGAHAVVTHDTNKAIILPSSISQRPAMAVIVIADKDAVRFFRATRRQQSRLQHFLVS
jgi:hypothetical protein